MYMKNNYYIKGGFWTIGILTTLTLLIFLFGSLVSSQNLSEQCTPAFFEPNCETTTLGKVSDILMSVFSALLLPAILFQKASLLIFGQSKGLNLFQLIFVVIFYFNLGGFIVYMYHRRKMKKLGL